MIHSHKDPWCHDPQKSHFCGKGVIAKRGEATVHRSRTGVERITTRSSEEERRVDALALRADERRDKLR